VGAAGNGQLVRSTLVEKEIPERTSYLDELPA